jgi:sterol desaturase/sphingolipid hydroxylase (fatty acid hydroxylase superfamily)
MKAIPFILLSSSLALMTYLLASLLQTVLHRIFGHHFKRGRFYQVHVLSHHTIYGGDGLLSETYSGEEQSVTHFFVLPAVGLELIAFVFLPIGLLIVQLAALATSYAVHVYLHTQYHLSHTWLYSFEWFRRRRQLHFEHHRDPRCNFAVVAFLWDRIFGTYRAVNANSPAD